MKVEVDETMKLLRKSNNKMLSGVLAGVAEYFEVDPTLIRLIFVVLTAMTGFFPGVIAYIIAAWIMP